MQASSSDNNPEDWASEPLKPQQTPKERKEAAKLRRSQKRQQRKKQEREERERDITTVSSILNTECPHLNVTSKLFYSVRTFVILDCRGSAVDLFVSFRFSFILTLQQWLILWLR